MFETLSPDFSLSSAKGVARVGLVLLALVVCGAVDYATGYEVSVFLLYVLPVALATRFFGPYVGCITALLATVVWMFMDRWSGHQYTEPWIWYVNAVNRMVFFLLSVWAIIYFRARQQMLKDRLSAFSGDIPVCTQCQRLSARDGYWWHVDAYLQEFGGAQPHAKVCPDCARHAYARGGYRDAAEQGT